MIVLVGAKLHRMHLLAKPRRRLPAFLQPWWTRPALASPQNGVRQPASHIVHEARIQRFVFWCLFLSYLLSRLFTPCPSPVSFLLLPLFNLSLSSALSKSIVGFYRTSQMRPLCRRSMHASYRADADFVFLYFFFFFPFALLF